MVKRAFQVQALHGKKVARVIAKNAHVSLKYSTELLREIKGIRVDRAERFLNNILEEKEFLPLRKYKKKVGHRKGASKSFTKSGRYPKRLAKVFLKALEELKSNADYKGLDAENLLIVHGFASQGYARISFQSQGRISGKRRKRKATPLELIAREAS